METLAPRSRQLQVEMPSVIGLVPIVRIAARILIASLAADEGLLERVELPLAEAVTNAIVHGNRSDPGLPVTVELAAEWQRLVLWVTDRGAPFELPEIPSSEAPDPRSDHGRGLFLMRTMSDGLTLDRVADGNRVTLWWSLHRS